MSALPQPSAPRWRNPRAGLCNGRPVGGVLAMIEAGHKQAAIAKLYGVEPSSIRSHARKAGVVSRVRQCANQARAARVAALKAEIVGDLDRGARCEFILRHYGAYSAAEIAETLGISRNAVIGISWRARSGI